MDDLLSKLVGWYEDSVEASFTSRQEAERDRDYVNNKQWTAEEEETLRKRKQPCITINRIKPKIDALRGLERQMRTDPKAFPRTPKDEQAAHAATDALRYVCDCNNFSILRSRVLEYLAIEGCAGGLVEVEKGKIKIRLIAWDRLFYDPHSREADFSDAKYTGIVLWLDEDAAIARYGDKARDAALLDDDSQDATYADKPYLQWTDPKRKRIKVCEVYYREGEQWMRAVYSKGGFLEEPQPSPYQNDDGEPINAMVLSSCNIDRDNNRFGEVRQLIGPQDEINKRRSKALHLISVRQVMILRGEVDSINTARTELAKPDGVVEVNTKDGLSVLPTNDMAQGQIALLQEAKQEIDAVGANAAVQGKDQTAVSGRALQARQQAGFAEVGGLFDGLRQWSHEIYRHIWYAVKQFWTAETWVRVTDDERNIRFVGLNQPMTMMDMQLDQMREQGMPPEQIKMAEQQMSMNPMARMPTGQLKNDVAKMHMDIHIEDAPDVATIQSEQFQVLSELWQAQVQAGMQGPLEITDVIEASQIRNKEQILERAKQRAQPNAQQQQIQQAGIQLEMADKASQIEKNKASAAQSMATAQKTQVETALLPAKAMQEAENARTSNFATVRKATQPPAGPQRVQ